MRGSDRHFRVATLATLALAGSLSVFRCTGGVSCLRDSDCPSSNICEEGACTVPRVETPNDAGSDAPNDASADAGPDSGRDAGGSGGSGGTASGAAGEGGASGQ